MVVAEEDEGKHLALVGLVASFCCSRLLGSPFTDTLYRINYQEHTMLNTSQKGIFTIEVKHFPILLTMQSVVFTRKENLVTE